MALSMPPKPPALIRAAMPLRPYQLDYDRDESRNIVVCKSRRIGFTWECTRKIADQSAARAKNEWHIVSRTQDTAKAALAEVANHFGAMAFAERRLRVSVDEVQTDLFFDGIRVMRLEAHLANGSRITAMTSHPDALRGQGGNVLLDEFAFVRDSYALWRGASSATLLGGQLIVCSTPNYQQGKFFEVCKQLDMADGRPPAQRKTKMWSCHWVDIFTAVAQGFPVSVDYCRELAGDDDTFQQEYCCIFLADGECFIPFDLITAAESLDATLDADLVDMPGPLFLGMDIGRRKDRTVLWVASLVGDVLVTRAIRTLTRASFAEQEAVLYQMLPFVQRAALDGTGLGMQLGERACAKFGPKVEVVEFTQPVKERMALDLKRRFEDRRLRIPELPRIRSSINAVKRYTSTNGSLRFDAARTEQGHADEFWALALCNSAASEQPTSFGDAQSFGEPATSELTEVVF